MNLNLQKIQVFSELKVDILFKALRQLLIKGKTIISAPSDLEEAQDLIKSIEDVKQRWWSASSNFEFVCDSDVIDYYIYEIKAFEAKYDHLLKIAKQKGIKLYIQKNTNTIYPMTTQVDTHSSIRGEISSAESMDNIF